MMKAYINSRFGYSLLVWIMHSRSIYNKINRIHERLKTIVQKDKFSSLNIINDGRQTWHSDVLLLIVFLCYIKINKPRYLTSDVISITFNINGSFDAVAEICTSSSLFVFKLNREFLCFGCRKNSFLTLLHLWCGDIERYPGQPSIRATRNREV